MNRKILFKAKRKDNGEWIFWNLYGELCTKYGKRTRLEINKGVTTSYYDYIYQVIHLIDTNTTCQNTGLTDKRGNKIWENDITKLILPNGEIRYFKVSIKSVVREVLNHPNFIGKTSKVEITGVVFEWNGFELFPCIDTYGKGIQDYKEMEIEGNIFDNADMVERK